LPADYCSPAIALLTVSNGTTGWEGVIVGVVIILGVFVGGIAGAITGSVLGAQNTPSEIHCLACGA
jgi:ABC-type xylose transport system permease subunit